MVFNDGDIVTFRIKDGSIFILALGEVCNSTPFSFVIRDLQDGKRYTALDYKSVRHFWVQIGDKFTFGSSMYPEEFWVVSDITWDDAEKEYYLSIIDDSGEVTDYFGIKHNNQQNEIHFIDEA